MGLDIIFPEDIRNTLLAADEAVSSTARMCAAVGGYGRVGDLPLLQAYLEGYRAALTTVALAFGLSPAIIASPGDTLEMQARTVGEALHAGEEGDPTSLTGH